MKKKQPGPADGSRSTGELERALIEKLVSIEFPGSEELSEQLKNASITWRISKGAPALLIAVPDDTPLAPVKRRIPIEAEAKDEDGRTLHLLLHVVDGRMNEVEVFREDGERVRRLPRPQDLRVVLYD